MAALSPRRWVRAGITYSAGLLASAALLWGCSLFVDLGQLSAGEASSSPEDASAEAATLTSSDASALLTDGAIDARDAPLDEAGCPNGGGPQPVRIDSANASFCIDSTEVTRGQYTAFLASGAKVSDLPAVCQWKTGFIPGGPWPPAPDEEKLPASNVDWCDALAFCAWSGKHLCGRIGGGPVANPRDANTSEWLFACSKGGERIFPYGNSYDPAICNGADLEANRALDVASLPGCVGGWDGIFDMSGNVHELLDSCTPAPDAGPPEEDRCGIAESAYDGHGENDMKCATINSWGRSQRNNAVGFRCCSN